MDGRVDQRAVAAKSSAVVQVAGHAVVMVDSSAHPRSDGVVGVPLVEIDNPFDLDVHRPISLGDGEEIDGSPTLPRYVRRAHDHHLSRAVDRVLAGASVMAVLVAGSSAGKTRSCWEALEPLRAAGGWRLWHPYDLSGLDAGLDGVEPRTVVWLNETQVYLNTGPEGERIAARLRRLLKDSSRGPVLVLGTLWPEHHDVLTSGLAGSVVRQLLDGRVVEVPDNFAGVDLDNLRRAARHDELLAWALEHAGSGQVTQYLAGAPELLARFRTAPAGARALLLAAMDARRLGHRAALPLPFLEHAARDYLTDAQLDRLGPAWLEEALAYTTRHCKGVLGPLSLTTTGGGLGRGRRATPTHDEAPHYRLADYLEQHAGRLRAEHVPPIGFWVAAAAHGHPGDMKRLGYEAHARGLFRDAAQLFKNATIHGSSHAAERLVRLLQSVDATDLRPVNWAARYSPLADTFDVAMTLETLRKTGTAEHVAVMAARAVAHTTLDNPIHVVRLMRALHEAGAAEQVTALAARAAADIALDKLDGAQRVLKTFHQIGQLDQVAVLARRIVHHTSVDDPALVSEVLATLRRVEATEPIVLLAARAAATMPVTDVAAVLTLSETMRGVGATAQAEALRARVGSNTVVEQPRYAADLVGALVERSATRDDRFGDRGSREPRDWWRPAEPGEFTVPSEKAATEAEEAEPTRELTERAARTALQDLQEVAELLEALHRAGAAEDLAALAARAAGQSPLDSSADVRKLLETLHRVGAAEQVALLEERLPAAGLSSLFLERDDHRELFRFGREPDGTAAPAWTWDDLY